MNTMNKLISNFKKISMVRTFCTGYPVQMDKIVPEWSKKLKIANPDEDLNFTFKCIVSHILKQDFTDIQDLNNIQLNQEEHTKFERLCECRIARVPIQYILGEWDFMDLNLKMSPTVFIPRPETEDFVKFILKDTSATAKENLKFLEVGCGTGAISLSLLKNLENSKSVALDRSKIASELTRDNAKRLGVSDRIEVHCHRVKEEEYLPETFKESKFDMIVSNPPYVKTSDLISLEPEIKLYENLNALDGGPDGLNVARMLCSLATIHLVSGGKLWMELDGEHPPLLKQHVEEQHANTLQFVSGHKDCFGKERFVELLRQ